MFGTNKKKKIKIAILAIIVFLSSLIGFTAYGYYQAAKTIKHSVNIIKSEIKNIQTIVAPTQDFAQAKESLDEVKKSVIQVQQEITKLTLPKILPQTKKEVKAVQNVLQGAVVILDSTQKLADIGAEMYEDLGITGQTIQELDFSKLDSNQKGNVIVAIRQASPVIKEINQEVNKIQDDIEVLINSPWTKYINQSLLEKIKKLSEMGEVFDLVATGIEYLPEVVGYPILANYLLLLQNNTELRPTGGFIGTYGILELENARMKNMFIDDVYNLDKTVKTTMFVEPPWQLKRWNDTAQWFLRDANWSPDFPTSAVQAEWFYNEESKEDLDFNGVVAITPNVMADLLKLIGPITVRGLTFTPENFVEVLEHQVEVEFRKLGIPLSERKVIITEIALEARERLEKLSLDQIFDLAKILLKNLNEKHILVYFDNPDIQKIVQEKNWAGEVRSADGDYLMVIDANIGSLKTDLVMDKKIDYRVRREGDDLIAKVILTYYNDGKFAWNTTRYRTYTRVYVPLGSELIMGEGMMANDRTREVGEVVVEEEFGKTVFGAFFAIEPKETRSLSFEYRLPSYIVEQVDSGDYELLVQKQAGTDGHEIGVEVLGESWEGVLGVDWEF